MNRRRSFVQVVSLAVLAGACAPTVAPPRVGYGAQQQQQPAPGQGAPGGAGNQAQVNAAAGAQGQQPPQTSSPKLEIAVVPIEDSWLFRAERRALRGELARLLSSRLPQHTVLPLADVDAKLSPVTKAGERCAYEGVDYRARAIDQGWQPTDVFHVAGMRDQPETLWVEVERRGGVELQLIGPWDPKLERVQRYRAAFGSMNLQAQRSLLLGGLGMSGGRKGRVTKGELTLCERWHLTGCYSSTTAWADRAPQLTQCFAGSDERSVEALVSDSSCELTNLHDASGELVKLETCVCNELKQSAGMQAEFPAKAHVHVGAVGKRRIQLSYVSKEIASKPRPSLRVVETSSNVRAELDWLSVKKPEGGYTSMRRLGVANLDALAPKLAHCTAPKGAVVVADLSLTAAGHVSDVTLLSGPKQLSACVKKQLGRGELACTEGGKAGRVRVAATWP